MAIQFSQHHLLKRLSFLHCMFLASLSKINCPYLCVFFFWVLNSIPLVYVCVFLPIACCFDYCSPVVQAKVRECDTSSIVLFS
uniref:Uncharacterized protein n=1 Tax=Rhinolophus ferrumequinum TaxID=59479 RepID=A0A671G6U3_RHIFE